MKRLALILTVAVFVALCLPVAAQAAFGLKNLGVSFEEEDGSPTTQAGSHPFAMKTNLDFNTVPDPIHGEVPDQAAKDVIINLPPGMVADPTAIPTCPPIIFFESRTEGHPQCSNNAVIGEISVEINEPGEVWVVPLFNLEASPGNVIKLGFIVAGVPVTLDVGLSGTPPYNGVVRATGISQLVSFYANEATVWGDPSSSAHDSLRGSCLDRDGSSKGICPAATAPPLLTLPRSCSGPLGTNFEADSWQNPGVFDQPPTIFTPNAATGCLALGFKPSIMAQPTTKAAQSPTGLNFSLDVKDEGLKNPAGLAQSDIKRVAVTLPEGFTTNPSLAEGLAACSEADLSRETLNSLPGVGCPNESKIGTVEVESPLLNESVDGSLFIATPYENEVGSLLALYMVIKNPKLGIIVKQALKVEPNEETGRLTTVAEDIPQLPFSHFRLHFREGTRSPLASPPLCGEYAASAVLTPWSGSAPITTTSLFSIISGPSSGPCPSGGTPPFHPGLEAGTINNAAARYSPFYIRLSRGDGEQEITHFSIKLPPGITGRLAGIPYCSEAAIAAAKARERQPHGGQEELERPSCPAGSEVGHTLVGAGVGPSLAYAPGKVYLAGPYHGSPLSFVAITAAKVGPFDLGTVVVRQALRINPETAEVFVDATGTDPIPHIIHGIQVHLRDIRVYVNRPNFVINPTNCSRTSTASTVLGSGLNFASEADDQPVTVTSPFQAADCASLGFKPKLALSLKGGTKRGDTPKFKAVLRYPKGYYANIQTAQVTLPHSEFLEQSHIRTVCTRVQFAAGAGNGAQCPAASIYGRAKATTPLLDEPLTGPVYLRSSSHNLPDLVVALHNSQVNIDVVGRIDSVKGGRIRNTFEAVPDAPVSTFTLEMQGGKKGLLVNSTNICRHKNRAVAHFVGQNGKVSNGRPLLKARCRKGKKKQKHSRKARPLLRALW